MKRIITFKEEINTCPAINGIHALLLRGDVLGNVEVPKLLQTVDGGIPTVSWEVAAGRVIPPSVAPSCKLEPNFTPLCF